MKEKLKKYYPEIIAPAGDKEMMKAAVENGADAVYFGLKSYNARMRAANFDTAELPQIMQWLHERGVKGYVTLNTLVFTNEIDDICSLFKICSESGVDAVMVQDIGIAAIINKMFPDLPIFASTQMSLTSSESIKATQMIGINLKRVVIARELTLEDLRKIKEKTDIELEIFIHGALCISYSGQCLASLAIGGRSANRGVCAQPCRLPYDLVIDGKLKKINDINYPISPRDLCTYQILNKIVDIGIEGLKIEGRLKTPVYVAAAVRTYREAIDRIINQQNNIPIKNNAIDDIKKLEQIFSRGFTKGYLEGTNHQEIVEGKISKKRGIYIGKVSSITSRGVILALEADLNIGDGVVFESNEEVSEEGGRIYEIWDRENKIKSVIHQKDSKQKKIYEITFGKGKINFKKIKIGSNVWKTSDPMVDKEITASFSGEGIKFHRPINCFVRGNIGSPLILEISDWEGNKVIAEDAEPAEYAYEYALNENILNEQLGRLGNTPFYLNSLQCELNGDLMVPLSRLNNLRRKAIEALIQKRRETNTNRQSNLNSIVDVKNEIKKIISLNTDKINKKNITISVLCRNLEQVRAVTEYEIIDRIYTDFQNIEDNIRVEKIIHYAKKQFYPASLRIFRPDENHFVNKLLEIKTDGILVRNLAAFHLIRMQNSNIKLVADYSLNVANEFSAYILFKNGFSTITPCSDLNMEQLIPLLKNTPPQWFETCIYQYLPMFHTQYCLFCKILSKSKDSKFCGKECLKHNLALLDRKGQPHQVKTDAACRNTIFYSEPFENFEHINLLRALGVSQFRIELLDDNEEDIEKIFIKLDSFCKL